MAVQTQYRVRWKELYEQVTRTLERLEKQITEAEIRSTRRWKKTSKWEYVGRQQVMRKSGEMRGARWQLWQARPSSPQGKFKRRDWVCTWRGFAVIWDGSRKWWALCMLSLSKAECYCPSLGFGCLILHPAGLQHCFPFFQSSVPCGPPIVQRPIQAAL